MPLDATGTVEVVQLRDRLTELGITPVSAYLVEQHKLEYRARIIREWKSPISAPFWRTVTFNDYEFDFRYTFRKELFLSHRELFKRFLTYPLKRCGAVENDRNIATPPELVDLALKVHRTMSDAEISVDYLYVDPVMNVRYDGNVACLGIWEDGVLKAIAKQEKVKAKGWFSWFR